jgi:hypothetical protein
MFYSPITIHSRLFPQLFITVDLWVSSRVMVRLGHYQKFVVIIARKKEVAKAGESIN